jgi:O-antigen/teichoic acid export membrane protein
LSRPALILSGIGVTSIAKNAGYLLGTRGLNIVVRFIYALALAHYLGPELYGLLNYGMSWYLAFLSLTGFGTAAILIREIGKDRNNAPCMASLTLTVRGSATIFAAIICGVLGWFFEGNPEVKSLLIVFTMALIGRSLVIWAESVFTGYEVNRYTFRLQAIFRTLEVIGGIAFLLVGGGIMAVAIVHAISWWLQALSSLALIRLQLVPIRLNWAWKGLKYVLVNGLPIGLGLIMVSWLQTGTIVLYRHMASSADNLGQLALAMQIFTISSTIPMAAGVASLPVLSRSVMRKDGKDLLYTETMFKAAFILGAAAGLAGLGIGPWLVDIMFGTRYMGAGYLLGFVIWLLIPLMCGTTVTGVYIARGHFFLPTMCSGAGAVVFTLSMPWLVSAMDTLGAVLATGAGMLVWALSSIWILARSDDLDVFRSVLRPLAAVLLALGIFLPLSSVNAWLALLTSWTALFCGTWLFSILNKEERYLLANLRRRWRSYNGLDSK